MTDAQVNDCAERLSQLGIPVNGSTNPKVGYIKNPMACERCVYGSGEHAEYCERHPQYEMNYACAVGRGLIKIERDFGRIKLTDEDGHITSVALGGLGKI